MSPRPPCRATITWWPLLYHASCNPKAFHFCLRCVQQYQIFRGYFSMDSSTLSNEVLRLLLAQNNLPITGSRENLLERLNSIPTGVSQIPERRENPYEHDAPINTSLLPKGPVQTQVLRFSPHKLPHDPTQRKSPLCRTNLPILPTALAHPQVLSKMAAFKKKGAFREARPCWHK